MTDPVNADLKRYREIIDSCNINQSGGKLDGVSDSSKIQNNEITTKKLGPVKDMQKSSSIMPDKDSTTNTNVDAELKDKMLYRATHPKKIGIFSAGGLSNQIVMNIKNDYLKLFPARSFETSFDIFNRALIPIPEPSDETTSQINIPVSQSDATNKILDKHDIKEKTQAHEPVELEIKKEMVHQNDHDVDEVDEVDDDDEEYVFEPDPDSKFDELPKTDTDQGSSIEDSSDNESPKHLSFKERAQHVLSGLKKRLGLTRSDEEDQDESELPVDSNIGDSKEQTAPPEVKSDETSSYIHQMAMADVQNGPIPVHSTTAEAVVDVHTEPEPQVALLEMIKEKDILFIVTCLDDPIDIENTLVLLELARNIDQLTIVISSLPRYFGRVENVHATNKTLQKLRMYGELVVLIPYYETVEFKLIPNLIYEMLELITQPGLINLDVADLKIIVTGGFVAVVTFGTGRKMNRAKDAFIDTLDSKLLNVELPGVKKALLNVTGGKDMTLGEVEGIAEQIKCRLSPGARLILGARVNPNAKDSIKLFLLLGVSPMQVLVNRYANE